MMFSKPAPEQGIPAAPPVGGSRTFEEVEQLARDALPVRKVSAPPGQHDGETVAEEGTRSDD